MRLVLLAAVALGAQASTISMGTSSTCRANATCPASCLTCPSALCETTFVSLSDFLMYPTYGSCSDYYGEFLLFPFESCDTVSATRDIFTFTYNLTSICQSCVNGDCVAPDVCSCRSGWQGQACNQALCPAGYEAANATACRACAPGKYNAREGGACDACPAGQYSPVAAAAGCQPCPATSFCPAGSAVPEPCPAGVYGAVEGRATEECSGQCSAGFYCVGGETRPDPPAQRCAPGRYGHRGQTDRNCSGPCQPGHYCPEGSGRADQCPCGGGGGGVSGPASPCSAACSGAACFCPLASAAPQLALAGWVTVPVTEDLAFRTAQRLPAPGRYSSNGVEMRCAAGHYAAAEGERTTALCDGPCEAGHYCDAGSPSPRQHACGEGVSVPEAVYCEQGSGSPRPVDPGYFSTPEGGDPLRRTGQSPCGQGVDPNSVFCANGTRRLRITWSGCAGGSIAVPVQEGAPGATLASIAAASAVAPPVPIAYSLQTPTSAPSGCPTSSALVVSASGVVALAAGSSVDYEACPVFSVDVAASEDGGAGAVRSCSVRVDVVDVNEPPRFDPPSGPPIRVSEDTKVNSAVGEPLNAVDPDEGQELLFELDGAFGDAAEGAFSLGSCSGILILEKALSFPVKSRYHLRVNVSDGQTPPLTDSRIVQVEVVNVPDRPVWTEAAGFAYSVSENEPPGTALLPARGLAYADADGDALIYSLANADALPFAIDNSSGVVFTTAPLDYEKQSGYVLRVVGTDGSTDPIERSVSVQVANVNEAPVLVTAEVFIAEDADPGDPVCADAGLRRCGDPLRAADPDSVASRIDFSLPPASPPPPFSISLGGLLTLAAGAALDFEAAAQLAIAVRVRDHGLDNSGANRQAAVYNLTVNVIDVNEAPVLPSTAFAVNESAPIGTVVGTLTATDPDNAGALVPRQDLFFSLRGSTGSGASHFAVDAESGAVRVVGALDHETEPNVTLRVRCTDTGSPRLFGDGLVDIAILDVPEPPTIEQRSVAVSVPENALPGTNITGEIAVVDQDASGGPFRLSVVTAPPGWLEPFPARVASLVTLRTTALARFDFEDPVNRSITVWLTAEDADGLTSTRTFHVFATNVNEPPVIHPQTVFVPRITRGLNVGAPLRAHDPDGDALAWAMQAPPGGAPFRLHAGQLLLNCSAVQFVNCTAGRLLSMKPWSLQVTVRDPSSLSAQATVTVNVTAVNSPPDVAPGQRWSVREDAEVGTVLLPGLRVQDESPRDQLQYFVPGGSAFLRVNSSGFLVLQARLDYEVVPSLSVPITVSDGQLATTSTVRVEVLDVDEPPRFAPIPVASVLESAPPGSVVVRLASFVTVEGSAQGPLRYYPTGGAAGHFAVDAATGVISVDKPLDFETRSFYSLRAVANYSSTGLAASATVDVRVGDVNEPPLLTVSNARVPEDAPVGAVVARARAVDQDARSVLLFQLGPAGAPFAIDAEDGSIRVDGELDYESVQAWSVTVTVSDQGGLQDAAELVITVTNVNDAAVTNVTVTGGGRTKGGDLVIIAGTNLGFTNGTSAADVACSYGAPGTSYQYTARNCRVAVPNTEVRCDTEPGVGAGLRWTVTFASTGDVATSAGATAYAKPTVAGVRGFKDCPTDGSCTIRVVGANFGPAAPSNPPTVRVTVGGETLTAPGCSVSVADEEIECAGVAGVGRNAEFAVQVGGQWSAAFPTNASYAPPQVASLEAAAAPFPTAGQSEVRLRGSNFGDHASAIVVMYGGGAHQYEAARCEVVQPHREVRCFTVEGVGAGHRWRVSVGGQLSGLAPGSTSYRAPTLQQVSGPGSSAGRTEGGQLVYLKGTDLGPLGAALVARYGDSGATRYAARSCQVITAHTWAQCLTTAGVGAGLAWAVEVGGQSSGPLPAASSYAAPSIFSYRGAGVADADTRGGQVVDIEGRNFGPTGAAHLGAVTYGSTGTEFTARNCTVATAHTVVSCLTAAGAGDNLEWRLVVGGQLSRQATTAYGVPRVDGITGAGAAAAGSEGGQEVLLEGINFGLPGALESVTYGPGGAGYVGVDCATLSHTKIRCLTAPGTGQGLQWRVTVAGQASEPSTATSSYAAPRIDSIQPMPGSTQGGYELVLRGANFALLDGRVQYEVEMQHRPLNGTPAVQFANPQQTAAEARIRAPPGPFGGDSEGIPVALVLRDRHMGTVLYRSPPANFSYAPPHIEGVRLEAAATPGRTRLAVVGENFGVASAGSVFIDGQQVAPLSWSHTEVVLEHVSEAGTVTVVAGRLTSAAMPFSMLAPAIEAFSVEDGSGGGASGQGDGCLDPRGGTRFNITGSRLCAGGQTSVLVGPRPAFVSRCVVLDAESQRDRLELVAPPGQGAAVPVVVDRAGQRTPSASRACYSPPRLNASSPLRVPTSGGSVVLRGSSFGVLPVVFITPAGGAVQLDSLLCVFNETLYDAAAQDTIHCRISRGEGTGHELAISAGGRESSRVRLDFDPPHAESVAPAASDTLGGGPIVIRGANFGVTRPVVTVGDTAAEVRSFNATHIEAVVPAWHSRNLKVTVTVAGQASAAGPGVSFSYAPPNVTGMAPGGGPTIGGGNVTLQGSNFGDRADAVTLTLVDPTPGALVSEIAVPAADILHVRHDEIYFRLPAGQGTRRVAVRVGNQASPVAFTFRYFAPVLYSARAETPSTEGGYPLVLEGDNFGVRPDWVRVGGADCANVVVEEQHRRISCTAPAGFGAHLPVVVSVSGLRSNASTFSYAAPTVERTLPFPTPALAGQELALLGYNMGEDATNVSLELSGTTCPGAVWRRATLDKFRMRSLVSRQFKYFPHVRCELPASITAGRKNLTLAVANRTVRVPEERRSVLLVCPSGYFGQAGERCAPCPRGARCSGYAELTGVTAEPVAEPGFYSQQLAGPTAAQFCEDAWMLANRATCPYMWPCEPPVACRGNNTCVSAYRGFRCAQCAANHFRLDGVCEECPDQAWLLPIGFAVGGVALAVAGYQANKRNINVSFLSIGVDYLQVLSMFARSKVQWPASLRRFFQLMSVFNFNLDLAAPKCAIPDVDYTQQWYLVEALPLVLGFIFAYLFLQQLLYKKFFLRRSGQLLRHGSAMLATVLTSLYFLYLHVTRTTLDIFNCTPTSPPDGYTYMEAEMIRCYESGGLHEQLLPPAYAALFLFTLGFPCALFALLHSRRKMVIADQLLRTRGLGNSRVTAFARTYAVRKQLHKLYYHYKPERWYWSLVIIARKFLIAGTGLMFRKTPTFQLAVALLVLFTAFVLHVRLLPFMSPSDMDEVWRIAQRRRDEGDALYRELVGKVEDIQKRSKRAGPIRIGFAADGTPDQLRRSAPKAVRVVLVNYNTVELVLLASAVLVALGGVMLNSNRFDAASESYSAQREFITACVIFVIAASLVYFAGVCFVEFSGGPVHRALSNASARLPWSETPQRADEGAADDGDALRLGAGPARSRARRASQSAIRSLQSQAATVLNRRASQARSDDGRSESSAGAMRLELLVNPMMAASSNAEAVVKAAATGKEEEPSERERELMVRLQQLQDERNQAIALAQQAKRAARTVLPSSQPGVAASSPLASRSTRSRGRGRGRGRSGAAPRRDFGQVSLNEDAAGSDEDRISGASAETVAHPARRPVGLLPSRRESHIPAEQVRMERVREEGGNERVVPVVQAMPSQAPRPKPARGSGVQPPLPRMGSDLPPPPPPSPPPPPPPAPPQA